MASNWWTHSSISWQALCSSMLLIDSHDTPRFRTIVGGNINKHLAGMVFLLTYPGVPSIFMGDEIGLEGKSGEDSRRTINWDDRTSWDYDFFEKVKQLINLRKNHDALINGGMRWVNVGQDHLLYLRESKIKSLLVLVTRTGISLDIDISAFGYRISDTLFGYKSGSSRLKLKTSDATAGVWELEAI